MPESGEWFSPRTRPEMLTSDDPPIPGDKPERIRILPGPATAVARATAPARRVIGFVPNLGRRIVRADDDPSRLQLVGMWASGSAIVAATGLAVAAVLGGAPPALTQPFERLAVLPGIIGDQSNPDDSVTSADKATTDGHPTDRHRTSAVDSRSDGTSSYTGGYSGGSSSVGSDTVWYPEDLTPGRPAVPLSSSSSSSSGGTSGGTSAPPSSGDSGTVTAPPSDPTTAPPTDDPAPPPATDPTDPTEEPTDPATPPTDPAPPTEDPTDPAPPTDPEPPADTPPPDTPPADAPSDPPVAEEPVETPPADPAPDPSEVTTAPATP